MDVREMLERAAKAVGYCAGHYEDGDWLEIRYGYKVALSLDSIEGHWSLLEDSSHTFRLAAQMGFTVDFLNGIVRSAQGGTLALPEVDIKRAIVIAAATIESRTSDPNAIVSGTSLTARSRQRCATAGSSN